MSKSIASRLTVLNTRSPWGQKTLAGCRRSLISGAWFALYLCILSGTILSAVPEATAKGSLVIAGSGPEQLMMETLAQAFERQQPNVYIDVLWDRHAKPADQLRSGEAHIAVTGTGEPDLQGTQIAWDGIGVVVHLSNNAKDLTAQQIAEVFSGKYAFWSELGGPETKIHLIDRPRNENVRDAFEEQLGIRGKIPPSASVVAQDEKVVKTVVGMLPPNSAVAFLSLEQALAAVRSGVAIRLLPIDKVEPEEPTVKDGRYKLRRPVLLLSAKDAPPVVRAFEQFCLSPAAQKIIDEFYTPLSAQ